MFRKKNSEIDGYAKRLQRNDPTLTEIDLSNSGGDAERKVGDVGAKRLADALMGNHHLTKLNLWGNGIGNEGARALASMLASNNALTYLDLRVNTIGNEGAKALASALTSNSTLTGIEFTINQIGNEGAKALASALASNNTLKELHLTGNKIGDEGTKALAHALTRNDSIVELDLARHSITNEGVASLASALMSNDSLTRLHLYDNCFGNEGAKALADALISNHTLTYLSLSENSGIIDESLDQKISTLLKMNKSGPEEAARQKEAEYGVIAVNPLQQSSPFFVKLMKKDDRNINLKINELIPLINDVHQLKIFYTMVASCLRSGAVSDSEAASYIKRGLDESWALCSSEQAIVVFKLILERANEDGHIPRADFHLYDNRAEVTRMEHAPFIRSMREAIRANTARIEGLEANVEAVNNSINSIKKGLRRKQKAEATIGLIGAVVNALTLGMGGSLLAAAEKTLGSIVDFGDVVHMKKVVADVGDHELMDQFELGVELGVEIVSGRIADDRLEKAIKEDNVLVVLSAAAVMVQQGTVDASFASSSDGYPLQTRVTLHSLFTRPDLNGRGGVIMGPIEENGRQKVRIDGMATEVCLKVSNLTMICDKDGNSGDGKGNRKNGSETSVLSEFGDAILKEEEEEDLPVHAAIKYGDKECLEEVLAEEGVDVNKVDSEGRTAMDLAALTGQLELLQIVKDNGGKFKLGSAPKMKIIAKKRGPNSEKYLDYIMNKV